MEKYSKSSITSTVFPVVRGEVVLLPLGGIADYSPARGMTVYFL